MARRPAPCVPPRRDPSIKIGEALVDVDGGRRGRKIPLRGGEFESVRRDEGSVSSSSAAEFSPAQSTLDKIIFGAGPYI